jgi:hypothetical protein
MQILQHPLHLVRQSWNRSSMDTKDRCVPFEIQRWSEDTVLEELEKTCQDHPNLPHEFLGRNSSRHFGGMVGLRSVVLLIS